MPKVNGRQQPAAYIDPERLYSYRGFQISSGISQTRIREARLMGLPLPILKIGRRNYVRGREAIEWMEKLAELTSQPKAES
ncbi:MAG: hypothetical protein CMJ58_16945 [Planctomycetaceae bacterium]|nr:hypothetical protein [Planctomycetaceae bacterium]